MVRDFALGFLAKVATFSARALFDGRDLITQQGDELWCRAKKDVKVHLLREPRALAARVEKGGSKAKEGSSLEAARLLLQQQR